jgi:hypothetical protein
MRNNKRSLIILLSLLITIILLGALPYLSVRAATFPPASPTPAPTPTPTPGGGSQSGGSVVQTIFQTLVFPTSTLEDAIAKAINDPVNTFYNTITTEISNLGTAVGAILEGPREGDYENVAFSGLFTAGALAVPLFLLRLALYQWNKLVGEDDRLTAVIGDWVSAAFLAVLCGPFLDWTARLGWWMMGAALGETGTLTTLFIQSISVQSLVFGGLSTSIISGAFLLAESIAILLTVGGLLLAFFLARAVLFILAALGPSIFVCGVVPQMRWLRGLWIKGLTIVALLPLIAAGVFKVTAAVNVAITGDNILTGVIHIAWMLGMVGILMSVVGILGRITIGATADAVKGVVTAVKGVLDVAAMAAIGVASGGAGLAAAPAVAGGAVAGGGAAAGGAVAGGGAAAGGGGAAVGGGAAMTADGELARAGLANQSSGLFRALGMDKAAGLQQNLAQGHQINARRLELQDRMNALDRQGDGNNSKYDDLGFSLPPDEKNPDKVGQVLKDYGGNARDFQKSFMELSPEIRNNSDVPPTIWAQQHWQDLGKLARTWDSRKADESFREVADRSGINDLGSLGF